MEEVPPEKSLDNNKENADGSEANHGQTQAAKQNKTVDESPMSLPTLPPEMWTQIFGNLSTDDLQTVLNACPTWNKLLTPKKPSILLSKVLACVIPRLSREDALTWRLVCSQSKDAVDAAVPAILRRIFVFRERERLIQQIQQMLGRFQFYNDEERAQFLQEQIQFIDGLIPDLI